MKSFHNFLSRVGQLCERHPRAAWLLCLSTVLLTLNFAVDMLATQQRVTTGVNAATKSRFLETNGCAATGVTQLSDGHLTLIYTCEFKGSK